MGPLPTLPRTRGAARRGPVLRLSAAVPLVIALAGILGPLAYWSGAYLPAFFQRHETAWPDPAAQLTAVTLAASLFLLPAVWMWRARAIDILALTLAQNALIFCGYFYLDTTAAHIKEASSGILAMSSLAITVNAVGFATLFLGLFLSYHTCAALGGRLPPLPRPAEVLDRRLVLLLRAMSLVCLVFLAMPMALTHTVPLFQGSEARLLMDTSPTGRAFYNLGTTYLPFLFGGLAIVALRGRHKLLRWEPVLMALLGAVQLLTTNRYPLSLALLVTCSLISMEWKWPRLLLVGTVAAYLTAYTFLSGFTELLRAKPEALTSGNPVAASFQQAFLGDNVIDLRDFSWVLSRWDFSPLMGKTYLGGAFSLVPSGLFPEKKQWHLGMNALRIVHWSEETHFGLRITFFGESFLNFGMAGVIGLGLGLGALFGLALRRVHLAAAAPQSCLYRNLTLLVALQILVPLSNTSDAFYFWGLASLLLVIWAAVVLPAAGKARAS
ncbi:MAG: hypothetical protein PW734_08430 [Verrucomicrobium sp.]|nr:hypothetical protein [Verrucomicrobium sp.]